MSHILLEERTDIYRAFAYVLKQAKTMFFSLSGKMLCFVSKYTLYINGFFNSDPSDSICLPRLYLPVCGVSAVSR